MIKNGNWCGAQGVKAGKTNQTDKTNKTNQKTSRGKFKVSSHNLLKRKCCGASFNSM